MDASRVFQPSPAEAWFRAVRSVLYCQCEVLSADAVNLRGIIHYVHGALRPCTVTYSLCLRVPQLVVLSVSQNFGADVDICLPRTSTSSTSAHFTLWSMTTSNGTYALRKGK